METTKLNYSRGIDIFNPITFDKSILIVGAGGIGSTTAYTLAKMGITNITVMDGDEVEIHNCSSQFYNSTQVNQKKVIALLKNIENMADVRINAIDSFFDKNNPEHVSLLQSFDILILALDSIDVRKDVIESSAPQQFIIDPRMVKQIAIVNTLFWTQAKERVAEQRDPEADARSEEVRCTEKAVAFNAMWMAAMIWSIITQYNKNVILNRSYQLDLENRGLFTFN